MLILLSCTAVLGADTCDEGRLAEVQGVFGEIRADDRVDFAGAALADACAFPPALDAALDDLKTLPPQAVQLHDLRSVADSPELWTKACPAGPGLAAEAAALSRADRAVRLWEGCGLQRFGWFTADDLAGAPAPHLAIMAAGQLSEAGVRSDLARVYVRGLLGR